MNAMANHYDWSNLVQFMDRLCSWRIPGNAIVVYHHGKEVFRYCSGYNSVEEKTPMTEDLLLNIYSCSKVTTVTAALQLYEKGYFLLSDPLYEYIPEYRHMMVEDGRGNIVRAKNPITIQNLFTMTAGFGYFTECESFKEARRITDGHMDTVQVFRCFSKEPLHFEPGTHWNYSLCHDALAALVEVISGERFSDYVKKHIFEPLDIEGYYHLPENMLDRVASQYRYALSDEAEMDKAQQKKLIQEGVLESVPKIRVRNGDRYDSGGGGVITTVQDYAKLANALSMGGLGATGEWILSPATVRLMQRNQLTPEQKKDFTWPQLLGYGYGLGVRTVTDKALAGFPGKNTEFRWGGAAGATILSDTDEELGYFYAHHMLNPQEAYYQPRLCNVVYSCLK